MSPPAPDQPRMYDELAHLWALVSGREEYAAEAELWRQAIRGKLGPGRHEILELGVGGGHNLSHIAGEADLAAAFATAAAHLRPGGVFVTAPDLYRETFHDPLFHARTRSDGETELTCVEYLWDPDPADTTIEGIHLFLVREGGAVRVVEDRHVHGLFALATWQGLLEAAGFAVERLPYPVHEDGREAWLWVGTAVNRGASAPAAPARTSAPASGS